MSQIASLHDFRQEGPPADIGVFQSIASVIVYRFTFSGVIYYVAQRMGVLGWVLVTPPNTNFVTLINVVIAGASAGDSIYIKAGVYVVDSTITGKSGVSLVGSPGRGTVFDVRTMVSPDTIIMLAGTSTNPTTVPGALTRGAATVTLTDAAGYAADDYFYIYNATVWKGNNMNQKQGEIQQVHSVAGNVITLRGTLHDSYAAGASCYEIVPVRDVTIRDIGFLGDDTIVGIKIRYCVCVHVENCYFDTIQRYGIDIDYSVNCAVDTCNFLKCNEGGLGYGIIVSYAADGIRISHCDFNFSRHGVAIGGGTGDGIPRDVITNDCHSYYNVNTGTPGACFDCHNVGENIRFENCVAYAGWQGFNLGMVTGGVYDCSVVDMQDRGVYVSNTNAEHLDVRDTLTMGCKYGMAIYGPNTFIDGCTVILNREHGMNITVASNSVVMNSHFEANSQLVNNSYSNIYLTNSTGVRIINNTIKGGTTANKPLAGVHLAAANAINTVVKDNNFDSTHVTYVVWDQGTGTIFNSKSVPFNAGTTLLSADGAPWGYEIDAATEYALSCGFTLPYEIQRTMRIRVKGIALVAEADGMRLLLVGNFRGDNEAYNTEAISVTKTSTTLNFAANDSIEWVLTAADDVDVDDGTGGDSFDFKVVWADIGGTGNVDCATDCAIQSVSVEYV